MATLTYTCEDTDTEVTFKVDPFYNIDDFLLFVIVPMLRAVGYTNRSISSGLEYVGEEVDD